MFKRVLVPVDFSEPSRAALRLAIALSKGTPDASITVLHLYGIPALAFGEGAVFPSSVLASLTAAADEGIRKLCKEHEGAGVPLRPVADLGSPIDIVRHAEFEQADLIVMGTHGRTGLPHLLLGSFAQKVVRSAKCPVLTVRDPTRILEQGVRRILVATDLGDMSRPALLEGFALGRQLGAEVLVLHVVEPPYPTDHRIDFAPSEVEVIDAIRARRREADGKALHAQVEEARLAAGVGVPTRWILADGIPADAIVTAASTQGADLIVLGTHGRTGTQHLFLGSIAERVMRTSPVPTLTVRAGAV